jgi:MFS family permease
VVLLATGTLHVSTRGFGLLPAAAAVGGVLGSLVNARIVTRIGVVPALLCSLVVNVVVFVAIGFSPNAATLGSLLAVNGLVTSMWSIGAISLRQRLVPATLLGRVASANRMLSVGFMPFGALAGGLVASELGLRAAYPIAGAVRGLALLAALPMLIRAAKAAKGTAGENAALWSMLCC